MKRWIAMLVVVLMVAPVMARADQASKQAKVKELFAAMHMDHNLDRMKASMEQQVHMTAESVSGSGPLTPAKQKLKQNYINGAMNAVNASFGWTVLEPEYVKLYAESYTDAELDGMLAFYKSPAGQAMLAKTPQILAGVMEIVHGRMGVFEPRMQALQDAYVKQMSGSTAARPGAAPAGH